MPQFVEFSNLGDFKDQNLFSGKISEKLQTIGSSVQGCDIDSEGVTLIVVNLYGTV